MRHFNYLSAEQDTWLFDRQPTPFYQAETRSELAHMLGATLYVPGSRNDLAEVVCKQAARGVTSMVVCLEDSISDAALPHSRNKVEEMLAALASCEHNSMPMLFIRPRSFVDAAHFATYDIGEVLSGFVVPKFDPHDANLWFDVLAQANQSRSRRMYLMPILESDVLLSPSERIPWLKAIHQILARHAADVLALRIGTTDIAGAGSLRRSSDLTVYSICIVRDAMANIISEFIVDKDTVPVITAGVWEHYPKVSRLSKPQLRQTPFSEKGRKKLREELISLGLDKLTEEITLDLANGLCGKTIIHPFHAALVNSLHVVEYEEFADAIAIFRSDGAHASAFSNKMNESKPHHKWAQSVFARGRAFGVLSRDISWVDLIGVSLDSLEMRSVAATL